MASALKKFFRVRDRDELVNPMAQPRPGDGIGYPVPYVGNRFEVDFAFLQRCRGLAPFSGAYRLNETTVIKTGEAVTLSEASAMRLVAEKTAIPVPKVLDAYIQESDGRGVILMEYVDGETLGKAWAHITAEQKDHIIAQLSGYMNELRTIKASQIATVDYKPCRDQFFTDVATIWGPYKTERAFHEALSTAVRQDDAWSRMVSQFLATIGEHDTVLTHNDFTPRNILVKDGNVVALLDWELSGFYPDYWEYVKAHLWEDWGSQWITERRPDQILEPKLSELAILTHVRDLTQ